ncbi:MAG: HAMP domain-containing histidine kinase [Spirulinaceae cyanobacterium SM2_1_0]|nr:HAMP domain-containing histidine kinase [Spirulinaceae cyanobacterium SM2_1_0]
MFQATRRRLALWYALITAVLLICFATGMYFYVRQTLVERIDDTLKHTIEVVERLLAIEDLPAGQGGDRVNIAASFRNNPVVLDEDRIELEWFDPNGQLLWTTFSTPPNVPLQFDRRAKTVRLAPDYLLRQVTHRLERGRQVLGYLRASHPWFEVTKPTRQLSLDLLLWTSAMVLCVAGSGWLLSGLAMKPVRESYQSLKQFTADASHELRNPIATIQANVQTALAYPDADPQLQQQQLQVVERLTQRLGRLVNDLLFLARSDSGMVQSDWQELPLDALLIEAIEEQRWLAEQQGIYFSLHILEPPPELGDAAFATHGDWDQLARLFANLLSNALTAVAAQGSTAGDREVGVSLERCAGDRQTLLRVQVRDTGVGIPAAALSQIFDRFYRVDPARARAASLGSTAGAGLGLAIAQAIVSRHRGQISVSSEPQQGTVFTVQLPAATGDR